MAISTKATPQESTRSVASHPLDPLTAEEIAEASAILKSQRGLGPRTRFETVVLREPDKRVVLNYQPGNPVRRDAFIVVLDNDAGATYEAVVSLDEGRVVSWEHIPNVQPRVMFDEFVECEAAVRSDTRFQAAIKKRGITDPSLVMVDPWSAGNYGYDDEEGRRLALCRNFARSSPTDNGYARPIEGVTAVVDLNRMEVVRVDDYGFVPLPPEPGNYGAEFVGKFREDLKPLEITQPEGPSFQVDGWKVTWQKWHLRVGFTPREGLVIHTVGYEDQGRVRPILYRAALSDMVVPYGEPGKDHYRKNAFDAGEYGIGSLTNSLTLGCDCLGEIYYFDAALNTGSGEAFTIPNAVCMHEEDYGILWKHTDWRIGQTEARRSRRLVISSVATVGNYEYGFFWYFYQDGTIQMEVKLTGIINTAGIAEGETPKYGTIVAPQLNAHIHQHFFNFRMDMCVDGEENSVYEVNTVAAPPGPDNPHGNAFYAEKTLAGHGTRGAAGDRPHERAVLAGVQRRGEERAGAAGELQADAGGEHPALRASRRQHHQARGLYDQAPLGDAIRPRRDLGHRAVSQPASGRRGPARVHQEQPERGGHRRGAVVHPGIPSRAPARGLADFAGGLLRVQPEAGGVPSTPIPCWTCRPASTAGRVATNRVFDKCRHSGESRNPVSIKYDPRSYRRGFSGFLLSQERRCGLQFNNKL